MTTVRSAIGLLCTIPILTACGGGDGDTRRDTGVDAVSCDQDGDGLSGSQCGGADCDDTVAYVYPGAPERCNATDDDCDSAVDEDVIGESFADADGDGHGDPAATLPECDPPDGYVAIGDDCDDGDAAAYPGAVEVCDGADNDCDEVVDEGVTLPFFRDEDGDDFGVNHDVVEACAAPDGYAPRGGDCDDDEPRRHPGAAEACDLLDNDCDRVVDEEITTLWYEDADSDGYGGVSTLETCDPPPGWVARGGDCDDDDATAHPDGVEVCDGADDDCDESVDEGLRVTYFRDGDEDGWGGAAEDLCGPMAGYVETPGDCNDADSAIHPGAAERCNYVDDDCDTSVDEGQRPTYYRDRDGDGRGDPASPTQTLCELASGWADNADDCDDSRVDAYAGAPELCNGLDDDCDGAPDNGLAARTFYFDGDGDGYGVASPTVTACAAPPGYADNPDDCYDLNADAHPGATGYPNQDNGVCGSSLIIGSTCAGRDRGDGSYDYDCDGVERPYDTSRFVSCGGSCSGSGWTTAVPGCGESGNFRRCGANEFGCGSATRNDVCQCCN